jgi:hypothetical protein
MSELPRAPRARDEEEIQEDLQESAKKRIRIQPPWVANAPYPHNVPHMLNDGSANNYNSTGDADAREETDPNDDDSENGDMEDMPWWRSAARWRTIWSALGNDGVQNDDAYADDYGNRDGDDYDYDWWRSTWRNTFWDAEADDEWHWTEENGWVSEKSGRWVEFGDF